MAMPLFTNRVTALILSELARGERRVLSLVVAVGKVLERSDAVKGNLAATVKSSLARWWRRNRSLTRTACTRSRRKSERFGARCARHR